MGDRVDPGSGRTVGFGPFTLAPTQHLLRKGDDLVAIGSRALELLVALVERAGDVVSKDELVSRVWPDTFVEEGNLRVHIAALRRVLGDGQAGLRFIATVPGRGYRFVAALAEVPDARTQARATGPESATEVARQFGRVERVIGRDEVIDAIAARMPQRRFTTIVGPGGIGKTTVALAAAERLAPSYSDGARLVDLASISDPSLAPSVLAAVLGVAVRSENILPGLMAFLRDKSMLIVVDNCEHVVDAAASLVEALLKSTATVHVLATSREPLRVDGESVVRLASLAVPDETATITAAEALSYSAIQLFTERAAAALDTFEMTDSDAPVVVDICRRLDGIALAIELAAGRVDAFGIAGLASLLNDRFRVLTSGRRTALPRHQTLHATLDWSHGLLSENERIVFRRMSILAGPTALQYASDVVAGGSIAATDVPELIADLVAKSLVVADPGGGTAQYRLLDTAKAYALERLVESGERESLARHHAERYRAFSAIAASDWETRPTTEWLAEFRPCLDNLRAALDWAFSPVGDSAIGRSIAVATTLLWFQLSLTSECRMRVEQALASFGAGADEDDARVRMQLQAALAWSLMYTTDRARDADVAWAAALELAESLGDPDYQLRSLWGLWAGSINSGQFGTALALAQRFNQLAASAGDEAEALVGERMMAVSRQFLGEPATAQLHVERMLARYVAPAHRSHTVRFQFEQRITAGITLGRVLLLQGYPDRALRTIDETIDDAVALNHALSLCNALAQACPVPLLIGDLADAERLTALLLHHSAANSLEVWHDYGKCFQGQAMVQRGDIANGLSLLRESIDRLRRSGFVQYLTSFLAAFAEALTRSGRIAEARRAIDEALERTALTDERWSLPELHRVDGEVVLSEGGANAARTAEQAFKRALDLAAQQGALFWELRAATSLAALCAAKGTADEGRNLLTGVYGRFTEGFETADLIRAKSLLNELDARKD